MQKCFSNSSMMEQTNSASAEKPPVFCCLCKSTDVSRFMLICYRCQSWFHGDCVKVSSQKAKKKQFVCPSCSAVTGGPCQQQTSAEAAPTDSTGSFLRCGHCIGCFRAGNCGKCDVCRRMVRFGGVGSADGLCKQRRCVLLTPAGPSQQPAKKPVGRPKLKDAGGKQLEPKKSITKKGTLPKKRGRKPQSEQQNRLAGLPVGNTRAGAKFYQAFLKEAGLVSSSDEDEEPTKQCLGPGCIEAARKRSKYCSDECGLKLARERLVKLLPPRYERWAASGPCAAQVSANGTLIICGIGVLQNRPLYNFVLEVKQSHEMELLRRKQYQARAKLGDLDEKEAKLNRWLSFIEQLTEQLGTDGQSAADEGGNEDGQVGCAICGQEVACRVAQKHMVKCFAKLESQTSYGNRVKATNNPYNVFCDAFNKVNGTYCKRLRVVCPEHSNKIPQNETLLCGFPLALTLAGEFPSVSDVKKGQEKESVCLSLRKECNRHFQWDKIQKGTIDMSRLSALMEFDEVYERERALRQSAVSRNSVLALLMNDVASFQTNS